MSKIQSNSKYSALSSTTASSKKYRLSKRNVSHRARRKTSVEDLEEEGYIIGRVLGEGSYCKVR